MKNHFSVKYVSNRSGVNIIGGESVKKNQVSLFSVAITIGVAGCFPVKTVPDSADSGFVRNVSVVVPASWYPKKILGRDLHPMVRGAYFWTEDWKTCPDDLPFFRDVTVQYPVSLGVNEWAWRNNKYTPVETPRPNTLYTIEDLLKRAEPSLSVRSKMRPDLPFMLVPHDGRPPFFLRDGYINDRDGYAKWLKENPNFIGYLSFSEFESDLNNYRNRISKLEDSPAKARLLANFPLGEPGREELFRMLDLAKRRFDGFLFGDGSRQWMMNSLECSLAHVYAAKGGAAGLMYEAELGSTSGPWAFGTAFTRGAARQFGIPWAWYGAHLVGGFDRDGEKAGGELEWPGSFVGYRDHVRRTAVPDKGSGRTLLRRQFAYGMLAGANLLIPENFHFFMFGEKEGKKTASPYAYDINEAYEWALNHDRGAPYTPVALLFSIHDPFDRHGYAVGNRDPFSMNAFAFTLVPTLEKDHYRLSDRKNGDLGCLWNSEFGEIWDALSPDAGQPTDAFAGALKKYRAAFLVGAFDKKDTDVDALRQYVQEGGTLFVSADQIEDGLVSREMAGVEFTDGRKPVGGCFKDEKGVKIEDLSEIYTVWESEPDVSARPILLTEAGMPLAFAHDFGLGRVVTVAVKRMLPDCVWAEADGVKAPQSKAWSVVQRKVASGELTFPIVRHLLRRVQSETVPVVVGGRCQWGVNKTAEGWLFWAFNNAGVTKFVKEPEVIDPKATSNVTVTFNLKSGAVRFSFDIAPGGIAYREITGE